MVCSVTPVPFHPALIVIVGPTASGKSALAQRVALEMKGEIISCDSVALYRGLDIGSAKQGLAERAQVRHHGIDLLSPDQPSTAGDYARHAKAAARAIAARDALPILSGGTGLYLGATLDGLAPAPARDEAFRQRLRMHVERRGSASL
ncbi:MAG: tRNA (adenosine(37)-N6)-dimethylallyltransferase MiaA, partial [Rhodospirillales bacterium]|nr:tRNA (adenosine(37)-N6)-dimethylallyltransferase MiaA [Acetobacter sp.]